MSLIGDPTGINEYRSNFVPIQPIQLSDLSKTQLVRRFIANLKREHPAHTADIFMHLQMIVNLCCQQTQCFSHRSKNG